MSAFEDQELLTRYWINVPDFIGFGVTAYSFEDALALLADEGINVENATEVVTNVDLRTLNQRHVIPNAGPPCFRGVWFPCMNIGWNTSRERRRLRIIEGRAPQQFLICKISIAPRTEILDQ